MKKLFVLLFIVSSANFFAANQQFIKTNLSGVKVFLRGAELTHTAKTEIKKGVSEIVFTDVARSIDQNSLNVSAKGDFAILSVTQRLDYLRDAASNPAVKSLNDSLEIMNNKFSTKQNEIDAVNAEIDLLNANRQISGKDRAVTIAELQKMAEYFRKRTGELKSQTTSLIKDQKKIQKEIDRINKQLAELNGKLNQPQNEIVVTVSAKSNVNAEFTLSYLIYDAGWQPLYDVRVNDLKNPAALNYKANVNQNSGLDWNDVNIILSTRNPVQNNNKPELYPWLIDFMRPVLFKGKGESLRNVAAAPVVMESVVQDVSAGAMADYMDVNETQLSVEFIPSIKYSIPSDNKPHAVALHDYTIPAKYEYYAAPKLDNNAFLVAYLTNWNDYNLMPGQVNIYFEGSYAGKSFLNPQVSKDTLAISLGRDQGIVIDKKQLKDFTEDKFLSSDIERTFAFDIVVKNNKNIPVKLLMEDQLPIPQNEDIEVKLIDISGGIYSKSDGKVKWNIDLDASKSVTKKFVYSVRYPKDKVIPNL